MISLEARAPNGANKMKLNKKGQSLLETVVVLPFLMVLVSGLLAGLHGSAAYYLVDHWTYETSLCLAGQSSEADCRKRLKKNLALIPFLKYEINQLSKKSKSTLTEVTIHTPLFVGKTFLEELRTPLAAQDFKVAL